MIGRNRGTFYGAQILGSVLLALSLLPSTTISAEPLSIQMESFTPREVSIGKDSSCSIVFRLNQAADVRLKILDWDGELVAERSQAFGAGSQEFKWDTQFNRARTDGVYSFLLEASTQNGAKASYAPGFNSGLEQLQVANAHFDSTAGEITYTMPQMGMIRTRISRDDFLLIRTLQDWTPRLAGKYTLKWDGKDQSGNPINMADPRLVCRLMAYSLPENAFIITGVGKVKPPRSLKDQMIWRSDPILQKKFYHAGIPREQSHDAAVTLKFLDMSGAKELPELPSIVETVKARVRLSPQDEPALTNERFEICVYVDGTLWFEDEDGVSPFTFDLNPRGMNSGEHVLTVWVLSTADHMGVVSKHFKIASTGELPTKK